MRNQQGFTLIELVVVIVILGILAAVAVPKFVDMQVDARLSSVQGLYGALNSAASLAHAQHLVKGTKSNIEITMGGEDVDMVNGYPAGTADGIGKAATFEGFDPSYTGVTGTFLLQGRGNCGATYAQSTGAFPTITTLSTGCE